MTDDPDGRPAAPESLPAARPGATAAGDPRPRAQHVPDQAVGTDPAATGEPDPEEEAPTRALDRQLRTIVEWVAVAVGALAVALLIKTFLLQAFYIPSGSMASTLMKGDRVLVNKLSYDLHDVNRGDVVVFEKPPGEAGNIDDLIKRVIALPGETIAFQDGMIFVDGLLLDEPYIDPGTPSTARAPIPNCADSTPSPDSCTVPEGRVFVMGDNRDESRDSRFFGPVDSDDIIGRAFLKLWPISDIGFL